jgi:glutamate---cysteine ligase / carboxylate-amine ligase
MNTLEFTRNKAPSLGLELELQLVDQETWDLTPKVVDILEMLPEGQNWAKPELTQSYLELNSSVCSTVGCLRKDMEPKINHVQQLANKNGAELFWAATHPFSLWMDQKITPDQRYYQLVEKMQDTARRIVTFGMHVHVGVDSGDKSIMIIDRMMRHLPTLLALSVNSPFWVSRNTGLKSQRCKIMEQLPAAGLPPYMRNYSEYCWLVNHSIQTGFINSIREVWWDIRPHPKFGTVEVRICDVPPSLEHALTLAALIQCLVTALNEQIDEGVYQHEIHPIMVKQNKWMALRYGMDARITDPITLEPIPVRQQAYQLFEKLVPYAVKLNCLKELESLKKLIEEPSGAERQISL